MPSQDPLPPPPPLLLPRPTPGRSGPGRPWLLLLLPLCLLVARPAAGGASAADEAPSRAAARDSVLERSRAEARDSVLERSRAEARDSVLERWLAALGGRAAVETVLATYVWSRFSQGDVTGRVEEWNTATGAFKSVADFNTFRRVTGFDGRRGYVVDENRKVQELSGPPLAALRSEAYLGANAQFFPARRAGQARYLGRESADGQAFEVLELAAADGPSLRLFLDPRTFLPARMRRIDDSDTTWILYSNFRPVDGVMEPFRVESRTGGSQAEPAVFAVEALQHLREPPGPEFFSPPRDTVRDFAFNAGQDSVDIPFELWGDHVVVAARAHGSRSLPFLLDTGAEATNLDLSLARRWGLAEQVPLEIQGTGGSQRASLVTLDTLSLPGMTLLGQKVAAVDLSGVRPGGRGLGGVLGYDFLSRFVVRLDFEHHRMTLFDPARAPEPAGGETFALELDTFVPRIEVQVDDSIPARFQIDTGASATAVFFHPFWSAHPQLLPPGRARRAVETAGVGGRSLNYEARFGSLALGRFRVDRPLAFFHDAEAGTTRSVRDAGLLGMDFWKRFRVTLDYAHRRVTLEPNASFARPDKADGL